MSISFLPIFLASTIGSLLAMGIGGLLLFFSDGFIKRFSIHLLSFAAGALLGAAFFELLPEALESGQMPQLIMGGAIIGILLFFILEKLLSFYHCHNNMDQKCDTHDFSLTIIVGDAFHNFIDGIAIALSFLVSAPVGITTTAAIFFHEIPQEISDFGILLRNGYSRWKALKYNILSALATFIGALLGYTLRGYVETYIPFLLAVAAGSFIYISISDLLPELKHNTGSKEFLHILIIMAGMVVVLVLGQIFHE